MLQDPNADDPLDAFKAQVYKDNKAEYLRQARLHTATHAGESIEAMLAKYNLS
jgi:ubiquitin-protein ligase